ncbi:MAG: TetR/AcrR family transcriptional regulator [Beijerinckiaceae bacterium]
MPRIAVLNADEIVATAMRHFWQHGYHATSMDALVESIGASRHAIYTGIGSKSELYRRGFAAYQSAIVSPAFSVVEKAGAGLAEVAQYFETQIAFAESAGLPGPGCLIANAMIETAPHDADIAAEVTKHNARLHSGFANALSNENGELDSDEVSALADFLVVTAQGLWSMSRMVTSAAPLRAHVATTLSLLRKRSDP